MFAAPFLFTTSFGFSQITFPLRSATPQSPNVNAYRYGVATLAQAAVSLMVAADVVVSPRMYGM